MPITGIERSCLVLLSFFFGYLSWRFVENPVRRLKLNEKNTLRLAFTIPCLMLFVLFVAALAWGHRGWPQRFPENFSLTNDQVMRERDRYWKESSSYLKGANNGRNILIVGNSHSIDLIYALRENGSDANFSWQFTSAECFNFGSPVVPASKNICQTYSEELFTKLTNLKFDAIYLHDHWPRLDKQGLIDILTKIRSLNPAPIYVFGPKMVFSKSIPDIARVHRDKATLNIFAQTFVEPRVTTINEELKRIFADPSMKAQNLHFVDFLSSQCGVIYDNCEVVSAEDGSFYYFDSSHFTAQGAKSTGARLRRNHEYLF